MAMKFDMTNLGFLTYYLKIELHQREKDVTITQEGYVKKVLKDARMFGCNSTLVIMDSNVNFTSGEGEKDVDANEYQSLARRLRYFFSNQAIPLIYSWHYKLIYARAK